MGEGTKVGILSVAVTALLIGGIALWSASDRSDRLAHGRGKLENITPGSAATPLWVALESLEFSSETTDETVWRMSVYAPSTGELLSRKAEVPWRLCRAAGPGQLWCNAGNDEVELVALPGLQVLHSAAEVKQKVGQRLMDAQQLTTNTQGSLVSLLADGRRMQLDPQTLALSPAEPAAERPGAPDPFSEFSTCSVANSARVGLCRSGTISRVDTGEGFLRPERVRVEGLTDQMLLLTQTSLDEKVSAWQLVALDGQLKLRFQLALVPGSAALVHAHYQPETSTLLLAFGAPVHASVAVALDKGAERFRINH